jgi:NAD(P)-dependent dehydrogenase (short-subunit alcohol dehydrogenase family)
MYKDKVVLVTGAVRNTGLAIAEAFAREGAIVALNGRKAPDVAREAARLRETYGATVVELTADIAIPEQVVAMFETLKRECGRLDVLVNNAILQGVGYSLVDTPLELLEELFRVNVFGTYHCAQLGARMMLENGRGAIVNIGSNTALRAIKNRTAYVATKGAIDSLTRGMSVELGPQGIRVNSVVAGYIHTPRWDDLTQEQVDRRHANIPLGCEAYGSDIADAVLYMASDAAAKVNGTNLVVDGGMSSQLAPADCDV